MSDEELVLDNIKTWTGLAVKESIGMTEDRDKMDKVRRWCGQPSHREDGKEKRTEHGDGVPMQSGTVGDQSPRSSQTDNRPGV